MSPTAASIFLRHSGDSACLRYSVLSAAAKPHRQACCLISETRSATSAAAPASHNYCHTCLHTAKQCAEGALCLQQTAILSNSSDEPVASAPSFSAIPV